LPQAEDGRNAYDASEVANGMNGKRHLWLRLGIVSILPGILLAMFYPALRGSSEMSDYEWLAVLFRFLIFAPVCFLTLGMFALFSKWFLRFCRWPFTWRNLKLGMIVLAALALLTVLFYGEEDWRGKRAWEKCKRDLQAKGEVLDWSKFIPAPVPDAQNFALTSIVASCYGRILDRNGRRLESKNTNVVNRLEMNFYSSQRAVPADITNNWQKGTAINLNAWQEYFRAPVDTNFLNWPPAATNEFTVTPEPQSPAADVLLALSKYDSAIEELRQASRLPYSRFPLNYDAPLPGEILLPHLQSLRFCAGVLRLRAVAELQNGQNEKAFDDVKLALFLANSIHGEPCDFSQLARAAIVGYAIQPIWEGLAGHKWTEAQLEEIERELAGLDFLSDYDFVVRSERAKDLQLIDHERRTHNAEVSPNLWGDESHDFRTRMMSLYYYSFPSGWFYQNDITLALAFQQSVRTGSEVEKQILPPQIAQRIGNVLGEAYFHRRSPYYFYLPMLFPAFGTTARTFAFRQASIDMARTACALERYRLANSVCPETLDALAPRFIEKLPHDIINGQPLHYHQIDDGKFLLYSVGWNETDDGGVVVLSTGGRVVEIANGDWVWQYPAK
jgi:tetratricopeptide (TPR) repeat protein